MRTQKTDNGDTTYYYYDSNKNLIALTKGNYTLLFYYDSDGNVTSFKYNGTMYYYVKNLQGDVTKIVDEKGKVKVEYTYDAWGNILKEKSNVNPSYATVKEFNPFRYRGYVYDTDTGLYYLQSRYYDPFTGRFINADFVIETNTLNNNIFAFCRNNSVNRVDKTGTASRKLKYPGEIHAQVQKDICNIHRNFQKELSFKKSNGKNGRVDLLEAKRKVAYIWEIKPVSTPYSRAKKQIDSKGRTFSYKGYYVKYYYDKHGIIRYNYYEKADKKESSSSKSPYVYLAIGMSVIIVIGCIALAPETGGASLGGLAFA